MAHRTTWLRSDLGSVSLTAPVLGTRLLLLVPSRQTFRPIKTGMNFVSCELRPSACPFRVALRPAAQSSVSRISRPTFRHIGEASSDGVVRASEPQQAVSAARPTPLSHPPLCPTAFQAVPDPEGSVVATLLEVRRFSCSREVGGQAVLGRQLQTATPWLTERHGYDPTFPRRSVTRRSVQLPSKQSRIPKGPS